MGVSPLQLVNLHRNRRYIFRHKTSHMVLSIIFLEDKHKIVLHLSILYEYQQFFQHRICFSIQPPDHSDPWPRLARSTSCSLILLFNDKVLITTQFIDSSPILNWSHMYQRDSFTSSRWPTFVVRGSDVTPEKRCYTRGNSWKRGRKLYGEVRKSSPNEYVLN